jgi:CRISPR-associated protein Csb1
MEQALQDAFDAGNIKLPVIEVDFSEYAPNGDAKKKGEKEFRLLDAIGRVTSLQVPHRLADAILRDSEYQGQRFRESALARSVNQANPLNATAIFELCPTALVFGMWDSTGPKGGLGAKFERAIVSEVVGFEAEIGDLARGVRRDPLEASRMVPILKDGNGSWRVAVDPKAKGVVAPSKINHGSVPFPETRDKKTEENHYAGVTIAYAEQITTFSLIALRRLRFPVAKPIPNQAAVDAAARTVLAALGLYAATSAFESGMGLRSRCLLWPDSAMNWELLEKPGEIPVRYILDAATARELLTDAIATAERAGLSWKREPVVLKPSNELLKLVRLSQEQAVKEGVVEV